ncbi:hypothetical protein KR51_00016450 [Rubidibacter lacunae KORDI 51-2]|uniref:SbsA Ig-like domain-containing protein n=1 Tax=Rubidibacter lacunae KORDI 51-2 TaxID=582515 RepID=U5DLM9_9CHRO|nr:hypothetical protein [Rubidibacter lacunae]ERN41792.1 hypothetical protein KR51_00016450 [Rubidibacter lacunae KORDI 51-2]
MGNARQQAIFRRLRPLDRVALLTIATLGSAIVLLLGSPLACGRNCSWLSRPRVRDFTWDEGRIGRQDRAFILTFDRPMDRESVEDGLKIVPPLPGKFSWSGRRMAYTLAAAAPYGTTFELTLDGARARASDGMGNAVQMYRSSFRTRDRAFAYIGVQGEEQGRLVLYNLTRQEKTILTPLELVVTDFKPYPEGDRILFAATSRRDWRQGLFLDVQLYDVTTGANLPDATAAADKLSSGKTELVLDHRTHRILQFDLGPDGETVVVRRANRKDPADFGLWVLSDKQLRPLNNPQGGDFTIAPDGQTLAMAQGEGIALLPLDPDGQTLDFLPAYGLVLDFAPDGTAAAMVNFNTDAPELKYVRSLHLVTNQGTQQKLLETDGTIRSCQFAPTVEDLYCLLTRLETDETQNLVEIPYLLAIDLATAERVPLLGWPGPQPNIHFDLAPDGLGLLFDQIETVAQPLSPDAPRADSGEAIAGSRLWLLLPSTVSDTDAPEFEELPLLGYRPQWLP